jgi:hypothetical protein
VFLNNPPNLTPSNHGKLLSVFDTKSIPALQHSNIEVRSDGETLFREDMKKQRWEDGLTGRRCLSKRPLRACIAVVLNRRGTQRANCHCNKVTLFPANSKRLSNMRQAEASAHTRRVFTEEATAPSRLFD